MPEMEVITALRNSGIDVECGACMEVAFTGATTNKHTCACRSVFAVTTLRHDAKDGRTIGIYESIEDAESVLVKDEADADEAGYYIWAVIEEVPFGTYGAVFRDRDKDRWYEYNAGEDQWERVEARPAKFTEAWIATHPGWHPDRIAAWCSIG